MQLQHSGNPVAYHSRAIPIIASVNRMALSRSRSRSRYVHGWPSVSVRVSVSGSARTQQQSLPVAETTGPSGSVGPSNASHGDRGYGCSYVKAIPSMGVTVSHSHAHAIFISPTSTGTAVPGMAGRHLHDLNKYSMTVK